MDPLIIASAFASGLFALAINLPPLVGFLITGFILKYFGFESNETISTLSDLGVTIMLFTIGLKLDIKSLLRKEIWLGATAHNLISTLAFTFILIILKTLGLHVLSEFSSLQLILLGFVLSFSSTVFAIKTLEEKGDINAVYSSIAIGILVMQDIFAVVFLTASTGKIPEWYAVALIALPFLRPLFFKILDKVGHGEMLTLYGVFFALVMGAGLFYAVGLKADLGALIAGMLLASHKKASSLSKSLFNMKELFLVCFFLNIGLQQSITTTGIALAFIFLIMLPIKGMLYFYTLHFFKFRVRTSLLTSFTLLNYSEFGLIVGGLAFQQGWLSGDILVAIALAVSASFVFASPINRKGHELYSQSSKWLREHANEVLHTRDKLIDPGRSQVMVIGMGRIGTGAYDEITHTYGPVVLGVELRQHAVQEHRNENRNIVVGDGSDADFWERILDITNVKLVLLSMPHHHGNESVLTILKQKGFTGKVAAIASYPEDATALMEQGADIAFNIYSEAGNGFARSVFSELSLDIDKTEQNKQQ
ncbi:cation:proton antiporter [Vibrio sp.]|nr:cation:proton antiporter [Vibrio sp.]